MIDSDRQMDSELEALALLKPTRSVWPEIEKALQKREQARHRQVLLRYATPVLAASVMLALLVFNNFDHPSGVDVSMHKTVENAVKNARPQATFSNLQWRSGQAGLEALLVSAKPRRVEAVYAVETLHGAKSVTTMSATKHNASSEDDNHDSHDKTEKVKPKEINEF